MKNLTKPMGRISMLSLIAVACSGPVDGSVDLEQEDVAAQTSELRNGTPYDGNPTGIWNGVVKVEFLHEPSNTWLTCSGQVVSAQTILTAAHCITSLGVVGNPVSMFVRASRPAPGGGWRTVMPKTWAYTKYNPAFDLFNPRYDVGLVIAPTVQMLQNVYLGDAVPLAKTAPNIAMTSLGFGNYGPNTGQFDGLGRSGPVTPTYNATAHEYNYTAVTGSDTQLCSGDSGGPLKTVGLVYGLMSQGMGAGTGKCRAGARFPTTMDNFTWLKANIARKLSCSENATSLACW
jgi:V8-like Glu-specific endopeptidase